ncbi:MAG TPA: VWA domain-containing protein [Tenuifilaceae bacterium]|nr:VWA domain-containing protein [Tenuifilaceae bacterium]HPE18027.1 VWA domain-containing protein [Tenuifilaceae bacterium]HPJ44611.1 VWA domain-containing protein [Tenuifilaceae bacterium]HPQ33987.1 VWA domain-containing protein [Tenuifilaceae bacterium]HRX68518.1 VWA domain-containing protein [Tenuifilaceae bacterium]
MFRFSNPENLYFLAIIPIFLGLFIFAIYSQKRRLSIFGNPDLLKQLMPLASIRRGWFKVIILLLAITFAVFGLAGPQFGSKLTEVKRKGIELIIALDVSNSMLAQDIQPNRIERAKQAISRLVDQLTSDRIGLIVFAGDAYVQLPVTNDYVSAKMFLSSISPGMVGKQGTAMGKAIDLAASSFSPQEETKKVIVVISDGENHEDDPVEAAKKAAEKGIVVHAIGIGSQQGAPIPVSLRRTSDFLKDKDDNVVVTKLDEEMLSQVAVTTGGKYVRATNTQLGLLPLFDEINRLERAELKEKVYSEYDDQFQYLFAVAILLLVIDFFVLERKNRWVKRINLFGGNEQ